MFYVSFHNRGGQVKKKLTLIMFIFFLLIGCNNSLIHDEQTAGDDSVYRTVEVAFSEDESDVLLDYFNFEEKHPSVDFEKSSVIFAQTYESTCPKNINRIKFNKREENLIIDTVEKGNTCNDIAIPRTFVIEVDKEKLEKVEIIKFEGEEFTLDQ